MVDITALQSQLEQVEKELDGLGDRRKALKKAAKDLRSAIDSVEAIDGAAANGGSGKRSSSRSSSGRSRNTPRATVTPEDLVGAIQSFGGKATVEQLVEKLGLPDGRSLNGARRVAVDAGTISYEDRTYTLTG